MYEPGLVGLGCSIINFDYDDGTGPFAYSVSVPFANVAVHCLFTTPNPIELYLQSVMVA